MLKFDYPIFTELQLLGIVLLFDLILATWYYLEMVFGEADGYEDGEDVEEEELFLTIIAFARRF